MIKSCLFSRQHYTLCENNSMTNGNKIFCCSHFREDIGLHKNKCLVLKTIFVLE